MILCISAFICGCSNDNDEAEGIETVNIYGTNLEENEDALGKYYLLMSVNKQTYVRCIYIPFPEEDKSFAVDASLNNRVSEPILRLKDGTTNVLYMPESNAEFSLETGKPLNNEAKGRTIKVYQVSYDKKNDLYRLVYENK